MDSNNKYVNYTTSIEQIKQSMDNDKYDIFCLVSSRGAMNESDFIANADLIDKQIDNKKYSLQIYRLRKQIANDDVLDEHHKMALREKLDKCFKENYENSLLALQCNLGELIDEIREGRSIR